MLTIVHLTLFEARRRKIVLAAVICGLAFLAVFATGVGLAEHNFRIDPSANPLRHRASSMIFPQAGLWLADMLCMAAAVLLSVDTLSGEIESGVIDTLASKPLERWRIVLGKWIGHWLLTFGYLALLTGGIVGIVWAITGFWQPNMAIAFPLMLLQATFLLTAAIAGGTRLSTITNGIVAFGLFGFAFNGGMVEQVAAFATPQNSRLAREVGTVISLVSPTDALWRMAAYYLQPAIARDLHIGPPMIASADPPTAAMVVWAVLLTIGVLLWAIRSFNKRAL